MVTDLHFKLFIARGQGITLGGRLFRPESNPASRILDLGCGYGDGSSNMARQFRCKVVAAGHKRRDINPFGATKCPVQQKTF